MVIGHRVHTLRYNRNSLPLRHPGNSVSINNETGSKILKFLEICRSQFKKCNITTDLIKYKSVDNLQSYADRFYGTNCKKLIIVKKGKVYVEILHRSFFKNLVSITISPVNN